jgi:hypothetical protein
MNKSHISKSLHPRMPTSSMSTSDPDSDAIRRTRSSSPLYPDEPQLRYDAATSMPSTTVPPVPTTQKYRQENLYSAPSHALPDKPLIDRVTNEWMSNPRYSHYRDKEYEEDEYGQFIMTESKSPKYFCPYRLGVRRTIRYLIFYVIFLFACLFFWKGWLKPTMDEADILDASMYRSSLPGKQLGTNAQPEFTDMIQLRYLDSQYVPGATHASRKRLVVVGDIHGCKKECKDFSPIYNLKHCLTMRKLSIS